jgi:hypothetical protein
VPLILLRVGQQVLAKTGTVLPATFCAKPLERDRCNKICAQEGQTMRREFVLAMLIFAFTAEAFAGKIYGSITESGKPVAQGVKVEVSCGTSNYAAQTDAYGAFNLFAMDKGKCILKVSYQNQTPSIEVNSYDNSVQYDLILEKQGDQYTLKRK